MSYSLYLNSQTNKEPLAVVNRAVLLEISVFRRVPTPRCLEWEWRPHLFLRQQQWCCLLPNTAEGATLPISFRHQD